jgi:hypothetical protein
MFIFLGTMVLLEQACPQILTPPVLDLLQSEWYPNWVPVCMLSRALGLY